MSKKLGFWKRSQKVLRSSVDALSILLFFAFVIVMGIYLTVGFVSAIGTEYFHGSVDFAKYLSTLAFTLAGFTFLGSTLIKEKKLPEIERRMIKIFYGFVMSGFFGLVVIGLYYLPEGFTFVFITYGFMEDVALPLAIVWSTFLFVFHVANLISVLRIKVALIDKEEEKLRKKSFKNVIKEKFGFD